ncbi:MAG: SbcC/MukB-like Walker B domain-containing protein [Clostridium sp.]
MRPIKLKIKGLNSFIEEQTIDFDKLTDRGLFGIFGPTGSGKSTILDGITLSLYGDLARKSSNYINTNCDTLSVSFEFQITSANIKRYKVERSFKRDKKTKGIKTAGSKLLDITNGELILAEKVREVDKSCEEIIGLSLDDFTRTVVLPQGKFSEFLKLEGKQRREMLERLFNLQNYGDNLSIKLSKKIKGKRRESDVLLGELKGFENISDESLSLKKDELKTKEETYNNFVEEIKDINKIFKEKEELWKNKQEILLYKDKELKLKSKFEDIKKKKEKILKGEASLRVKPYIEEYNKGLIEFEETEKELKALKEKINKLIKEKEEIEKNFEILKNKKDIDLPKLKIKEERLLDAIKEEKLLNNLLREQKNNKEKINLMLLDYKNKEKEFKVFENNIKEKDKKVKDFEEKIESLKVEEALKNAVQKGIIITEKYESLNKINNDNLLKKDKLKNIIDNTKKEKDDLSKLLETKNKIFLELSKKLEKLISPTSSKDLLEKQNKINKLKEETRRLNEFSKEILECNKENTLLIKEIEEKKILKEEKERELKRLKETYEEIKIENLAHELRISLKEGEPCPVCGAKKHDFSNLKEIALKEDNNFSKEILTLEEKIKVIDNDITKCETKFLTLKEKVKVLEKEIVNLGEDFKNISLEEEEKNFESLKTSLDEYEKNKEFFERDKENIKEEIYKLENKISKNNAIENENRKQLLTIEEEIKKNLEEKNSALKELENLKDSFKIEDFIKKNNEIISKEREREKLSKDIKEFRNDIEVLTKNNNNIKDIMSKIKEEGAELRAIINEKDALVEEKKKIIKEKSGENENLSLCLKKIQENIEYIEIEYKKEEENKKKIDKEYEEVNKNYIEEITKNKELNNKVIENKEKLNSVIKEEEFENIEEAKKYSLSKIEIDRLKKEVEEYKNELSKIQGVIEGLIKKNAGREITEEEWLNIQKEKEEKEEEFEKIKEEKITLEKELKDIENKLKELGELLSKKKELDHELALLDDLEKLFKGKKFVEFVAITKIKYISHEASKRLKEISNGNYGLEVDENSKFIIRDYKNGGAERDASTLSGGETFLASLSLALALSAEIQLKGTAPLELFFLDEGFGTLDENLLEVVMESLERVHNDRLKVGIISHVEAIKNRVPVKLIVTPAISGLGGSKVKIERS